MQTQCVQEGRESLHHDQNGECEHWPEEERHVKLDSPHIIVVPQSETEHHTPQYFG